MAAKVSPPESRSPSSELWAKDGQSETEGGGAGSPAEKEPLLDPVQAINTGGGGSEKVGGSGTVQGTGK